VPSLTDPTILVFDLASCTGWACGGKSTLNYGEHRFPSDLGALASEFEGFVLGLINWFVPTEIVAEDTVPAIKKTTKDVLSRAHGMNLLLRKISYQSGIPLRFVSPQTWRIAFIGHARAPASIKSAYRRRKWLKEASVQRCKDFGWEPKSDDAADALGILYWAANNGAEANVAGGNGEQASLAEGDLREKAQADSGSRADSRIAPWSEKRKGNRRGDGHKPGASREGLAAARSYTYSGKAKNGELH
jgi:hypothetical protein